ncbi:MAG: ferrochelatase [Gammaproteobacteria bacterium]|nr:ferrochelatase [Gammaproteobacteria bacterium]
MKKQAVLLINLGTPDHCDESSVYRYLKEFLNDPRVIDLPVFFRWPLVNLLILPFRYKKSAAAYQKIWSEQGSPLLCNSLNLKEALAKELGDDFHVELAMRYGQPSIATALNKLADVHSLIVIPLFPQYSSAATGSAIEKLMTSIAKRWNQPRLMIKNDFYHETGFISAYAEIIQNNLLKKSIDYILFSYHGLPERHVTKSNCTAVCDHLNACPAIDETNAYCYRAQCYATTEKIAQLLGLTKNQYGVAFQSRLGRTPWIKPYTDLLLPQLVQQGIKNIAMVCPSFVADCLETLEEVNIRAREQWQQAGGAEFIFIPCLNHSSSWVKALANMIKVSN